MMLPERLPGVITPKINCVTGPRAFVGVTSVSPVTRAATKPITTASGTAISPAHSGI